MSGCGYEGRDFGASYLDSTCIDGYLWDWDSCDEPGGPLYSGSDIPCPACNTREYLTSYRDVRLSGNAHQRRVQLRAITRKLKAKLS